MANTYTQIHIHIVFTVQNQDCIISKTWKDELYKYITGIIQNNGHKLLSINGMPDYFHVFVGMRPTQSLSDLAQDVKVDSSNSYSKSHVDHVIDYIKNQAIHHKKKTFIEEYHDLLKKFGIEFDERYIFKPVKYSEE